MEKVFEGHIHHIFDIPLERAVGILQREFEETGVDGGCFLSCPHHAGEKTDYLQNIKMLWLKRAFGEKYYAFGALIHPDDYSDKEAVRKEFLRQVKEYFSVGFDGIKMLETYPSLLKERGYRLDDEIFEDFFAFMEENGYPITIHIANPSASWDRERATPELISAGRVYDETYPTKQEITDQLFAVLERHPKLKIAVAHFGFFIGEKENMDRYMSYENTFLDITPGGEQFFAMLEEWEYWHAFLQKHQHRIFYGSDFYAFSDENEEGWRTAFWRRPRLLRQFFETDEEHEYVRTKFRGVKVDKSLRDQIYRESVKSFVNNRKQIDEEYIAKEAERLLPIPDKKCKCSEEDLQYILQNLR